MGGGVGVDDLLETCLLGRTDYTTYTYSGTSYSERVSKVKKTTLRSLLVAVGRKLLLIDMTRQLVYS